MFNHRSYALSLAASLLVFTACKPATINGWSGYVEGDYLYLAAPIGGRVETLAVSAGQQVSKGAPLFSLDKEIEEASHDEAAARALSAKAQAANADKGKRREEIAVTEAQLANAQAQAALARSDLARQQQLLQQGFISKARIEDAHTAVKLTQARVDELSAALRVAKLPARIDERSALLAAASAADQVVRQTLWRSGQKSLAAPQAGVVAEVFFRPGEYVAAGQPVLSLLPPENIKLRFFVPESELGGIATGQAVQITCDACTAPIAAHISHIASHAEYTPPVIYSNAQRAKLVFMVEARLDQTTTPALHPGQPVEVKAIHSVKPATEKKS
ncbi:MAG: HlyD family efflux transporter periplasmic adaptor subunit [Sideroxyarcus sp.]|nr:HlyD family efflux transporter periplasmic adaptor subunit [Sideroxyarcus sp.]